MQAVLLTKCVHVAGPVDEDLLAAHTMLERASHCRWTCVAVATLLSVGGTHLPSTGGGIKCVVGAWLQRPVGVNTH